MHHARSRHARSIRAGLPQASAALVMVLLLNLLPTARADSQILIRLSFKVLLNPADGTLPPGFSDAELASAVAGMNTLLDSYQRGYRFTYDGFAIPIGAIGGFNRPSPSHYYDVEFHADAAERATFLSDVSQSPVTYAYDSTALNIYIGRRVNDQQCFVPPSLIISIAPSTSISGSFLLHQVGHFFELCNTQGCTCNCCVDTASTCNITPGDDGIPDTLPDLPCWTIHDISQHSFGGSYVEITPAQRQAVDSVYNNVMSFHDRQCAGASTTPLLSQMTELQLDRWADSASTTRIGVCNGRTIFVQTGSGTQTGRSATPFRSVAAGIAAASAGDIVLIRAGSYPERPRISTPLTLRTPKGQTARIGG